MNYNYWLYKDGDNSILVRGASKLNSPGKLYVMNRAITKDVPLHLYEDRIVRSK